MRLWILSLFVLLSGSSFALARDYRFYGRMSEENLRSYLSRSMTIMYLLTGRSDLDDNIRMMTNTGVKLAGRAVYNWGREEGGESAIPKKLERAKKNAAKVHAADPEIILQACIFEIVSRDVGNLAVPGWAFEGTGQPAEQRNFRYEAMLYPSGRGVDQWGQGASIPDVSQAETKLWFYYLAVSYINIGCEAIHYGQAEIMNGNDPRLDHWNEVLTQARAYAVKHARRRFLLCDAHVPRHGLARDGRLLLDFHSFPLRIKETPDKPKGAELEAGFTDAIYGKSKGGITPSGWSCEHLPYLAEFDNYGRSARPGKAGMGRFWVWGWDEITWFAQVPEENRNEWLSYAWNWVRKNDPNGYVQMPGARIISGAPSGKRWYYVNRPGPALRDGCGQEDAIKAIWAGDTGEP